MPSPADTDAALVATAAVFELSTPAAPAAPTAPPLEIATLELTLADPLNRELVAAYAGSAPAPDAGAVTQAQVARYGADLTGRLTQLAQANDAVRGLYLQAMDQAAQSLGPGTPGAVFVPGSGGGGDSSGTPDAWRFDLVAFTQSYAQAGLNADAPLAQRAFAALHGGDALQTADTSGGGDSEGSAPSRHVLAGRFELNAPTFVDIDGHPNRERMAWTRASLQATSSNLRPIALAAPPRLHNPAAVWFDATLGWVTPQDNVFQRQSFLDKAIPIIFTGVMTWATAGAFGIAGGAGVAAGTGIGAGAGLAGALTAGATFGAIGAFYGGLQAEGRIDLRGMLRGALTGAVTAGVGQAAGMGTMGLNRAGEVTSYAQRALAITGQATLQGALQEVSGGRFRDGFSAALAQGLGAEVARGLNGQIAVLQRDNAIDASQASALRQFARTAQSAVAMLARPDDPGYAFAQTFVNGLVGDVQAGLTAREGQGLGLGVGQGGTQGLGPWSEAGYRNGADVDSDLASDARELALAPAWADSPDDTPDETAAEAARLAREPAAPIAFDADAAVLADHDRALAQVNARFATGPDTVAPEEEPLDPDAPLPQRIVVVGQRLPYQEQVAEAVGGELNSLFTRGMQAASGVLDALEITPLANVKAEIKTYLEARAERGLSQAEMVVFGALYAANEALMPTSALDFAGGIGKGVIAAGAVIKLGGSADEIAQVVRAESRLISEQRALDSLNRWTDREVMYAPPGQAWVRKPDVSDAAVQLEASLTRAGQARPGADYAPHHLVGFGEVDRDAQRVFERFGLTPNEATNGVWISRDTHYQTYGNAYKRWVGEELKLATSASEVRTILRDIAQQVESGATPWKP